MRGAIRAFEPASLLSTAYFIPAHILATTDPQTAQAVSYTHLISTEVKNGFKEKTYELHHRWAGSMEV